MGRPVTSMPICMHTHHCNFYCSLTGDVHALHGLFRARAFENPPTFHVVAKCHWTVQWFIQANKKTSSSPLLINHGLIQDLQKEGAEYRNWEEIG